MIARRYSVSHFTTYDYSAEMLDGYSVANLLARSTPTQRVLSSELTTDPEVDERDDASTCSGTESCNSGYIGRIIGLSSPSALKSKSRWQ